MPTDKTPKECLIDALMELNLQPDVELVETKGFRWTLSYTQNDEFKNFGKSMIKLETLLQSMTARPIDLRLEAEADKNKREKRNVLWDQNQQA